MSEYWLKIFKRYLDCYDEIVLSRKNEIISDSEMTDKFDSLLTDIMMTFTNVVEEAERLKEQSKDGYNFDVGM